MKVLLICPEELNYVPFSYYPFPFGLPYISASLKQAGHEVHCVNGYHLKGIRGYEEEFRNIARDKTNAIDVIGVGGFSFMFRIVKEILEAGRTVFPAARILLGGKILECMPERIMKELDADYGVLGEGETAAVELLNALELGKDPKNVAGIAIRNRETGEVFVSDRMNYPTDLDALPFPDREGFGFDEYLRRDMPNTSSQGLSQLDDRRVMHIIGSRSCPFQCTFCFHLPGVPYRQRSLENCFAEIDEGVARYHIDTIRFYDEVLFNKNQPERVRGICEGMKRRNLKWTCSLRADAITDENLAMMEDSGCVSICFGIENISLKLLKSMRKGLSLPVIERAVSIIRKYKIELAAAILVFDKDETWDTFAENMVWWLRNQDLGMIFIEILSCPNSAMYLHAKKLGLVKDEIEYIDIPSLSPMALNATTLSEDEHREMRSKVRELNSVVAYYPGILKLAELAEIDEYGRERYRVEAVCPHCAHFNMYPRLHIERWGDCSNPFDQDHHISVWCKNCNRCYQLPNPVISSRYKTFGKRMYLTHYPPNRLLAHYLQRGGTMEELCADWPEFLNEKEKHVGLLAAADDMLRARETGADCGTPS